MATSKYTLPGAFHNRVLRSRTGEYFILRPDVLPKDNVDMSKVQVFQVYLHPQTNPNETYQVFNLGPRRPDRETGLRIVGVHWGTHTIIEPNANLSWADIQKYKTAFQGTGCLLVLLAFPVSLATLIISASL